MSDSKPTYHLWSIVFYVFFVLLFFALIFNVRGAHADTWILPVIMLGFGVAGALIGGLLGGLIGIIAFLFNKRFIKTSLITGSAIGFMLILILWQTLCISRGFAVCIPQ